MQRLIVDQVIDSVRDQDSGALFENVSFEKCSFHNCGFSVHSVGRRTRVRQVTLRHCTISTNCSLGPVILEDVLVEDCPKKAGGRGPIRVRGPALKHVTLRGPIAPFNCVYSVEKPDSTHAFQLVAAPELVDDNVRYYGSVDWALDIREATLEEAGLTGVPGRLVKFDSRTAALVLRERAVALRQRLIENQSLYAGFQYSIDDMLRGPYDSVVVAASMVGPKARRQKELDALQALRDDGIAEPA